MTTVISDVQPNDVSKYVRNEDMLKFSCPICHEILSYDHKKTSETYCGHLFCTSCIELWLKSENQCPLCILKIESIKPIGKYISREIENIPVHCEKCQSKILLSRIDDHNKSCPFTIINVPSRCEMTIGTEHNIGENINLTVFQKPSNYTIGAIGSMMEHIPKDIVQSYKKNHKKLEHSYLYGSVILEINNLEIIVNPLHAEIILLCDHEKKMSYHKISISIGIDNYFLISSLDFLVKNQILMFDGIKYSINEHLNEKKQLHQSYLESLEFAQHVHH
jgi:hypothetical protein